MPLGKLSKRQIQSAYSLLTEVQQVRNQEPLHRYSSLLHCVHHHILLLVLLPFYSLTHIIISSASASKHLLGQFLSRPCHLFYY